MKSKCQMTVSDHGKFNGEEHFWECGKPAKFLLVDRLRGEIAVCGMHANAHIRIAKRLGRQPALKPL